MAIESIAKTLGAGSGIDVGALVTSLVEAQFAGKTQALTEKSEKLEAQISGVAKLKSAIAGFNTALKSLVSGGSLASTLASSNETAVKASFVTGTTPRDLSASITVNQLASAQVSTTNTAVAANTAFKTGTLTLRMGRDVVDANGNVTGFTASGSAISISIGSGDATVAGVAAKINAAGAGVTAKVITDANGQRLSISGASGAAQAFEISTSDGVFSSGQSLSAFAVSRTSTTTTTATRARDAVVTMDGVQYTRTTNSVTDLIDGVKLDLAGTTTAPASITTTKPTGALTDAVNNFVATYNEMLSLLKEENDPVNGALRSDNAVRTLSAELKRLSTVSLAPASVAGAPRTLADLGVATARDGTLSVDPTRLSKALATYPAQVEAMFAERTGTTEAGLSKALSAIADRMASSVTGLGASAATYTRQKAALAQTQAKLDDAEEALRARLTKQYAAMDARTSAYKATMAFMDNQIKAWNRSDS